MVPLQAAQKISIHALREEGDQNSRIISFHGKYFNPRPPRGGRPCPLRQSPDEPAISIHAPRVGGDAPLPDRGAALKKIPTPPPRAVGHQSPPGSVCQAYRYFNPRPPRGGRRRRARQCRCIYKFQSTPSARRATALFCLEFVAIINFNPRPPRGGRLSGPW